MRAFGGTCPMCCGDLDDVVYLETGAAVCTYCGHTHVESTYLPTRAQREGIAAPEESSVEVGARRWRPARPIA